MRSKPTDRPRHNTRLLTPRELSIVRAVALGESTREAATRLKVSPHTVQGGLQRIYLKLGFASRAGLVRWAYETGLVGPGLRPPDARS